MNVNDMREALKSHYGPGSPFSARLKTMTDKQVLAIYFRLKNKGELK